ncbi:uncharacterized protein [Arachis hypogaea]|uniref:uncharacterized protein n=1 Tax=Arachis hypogaea TaxID=3818 RepID=UPI000DECC3B4|nr:uncharacterized protein LOC112772993 [Arachis hypogaea]
MHANFDGARPSSVGFEGDCATYFTMVKADPTISIRVLQGGVEKHFGYKASYKKTRMVYNMLIENSFVGTWVQLVTQPWPGLADTVMFHWVFWTFPPCIEAFKHCKPLISIDGTQLYGKYGGTLLMAIAQDGNANILPIAFAVVEGETKKAWSFFLSYLHHHMTQQPGVLVISDRHKSIDGALNVDDSLWKPPHAFQAFCTRHIASNFMTHFKKKDLKKVLINAVYSKSQQEFAHYFGRLWGENEAITKWLDEMPRSQWGQYANEGSECINTVMKGSQNLPITALVKLRYFRFTVEEFAAIPGSRQQNYQVLLDEGKCDCGYFQALYLPCRHVLAACSHARIDSRGFVHPVYRMESVFIVYRSEFRPIGHEDD